jgi:hypothetical protein
MRIGGLKIGRLRIDGLTNWRSQIGVKLHADLAIGKLIIVNLQSVNLQSVNHQSGNHQSGNHQSSNQQSPIGNPQCYE